MADFRMIHIKKYSNIFVGHMAYHNKSLFIMLTHQARSVKAAWNIFWPKELYAHVAPVILVVVLHTLSSYLLFIMPILI